MKVGIVFITHNQLEFTQGAISSVRTKHPHQVLVIDDKSTDGTQKFLTENKVEWVDGSHLRSLAARWNLGIQTMFDRGAEYVLCCNNDILFSPVTIDGLIERISRGDALAVVGENIKGIVKSHVDTLSYTKQEDRVATRCDWGMFLLSRQCWDSVGKFDENFIPLDFEDVDYHVRVSSVGGFVHSTAMAPYYHHGAVSKKADPREARHFGSRFYFQKKWGRDPMDQSVKVPNATRKLEIGPAGVPHPGYDTMDVIPESGKTYCFDMETTEKWPIPSDLYSEVLAIHVVEHLRQKTVGDAFAEVFRILEPGGSLRVHVPNGVVLAHEYVQHPDRRHLLQTAFYGVESEDYPPLYGHKFLYDLAMLYRLFEGAGFVEIKDVTNDHQDLHDNGWAWLSGPISLKVAGKKP